MFTRRIVRFLLATGLVTGLASCAGGNAVEEETAALTSQPCVQGGPPPPGTFMSTPCTTTGTGTIKITMCTCYPTSPTNPSVVVDWSMPDQTGTDPDYDGIVNLSPPGNPPSAGSYLPTSWAVTLSACGSTPAPAYAFDITLPTGVQHIEAGASCSGFATVPAQGTYEVVATAKYANGSRSASRTIRVKNYLVVSLGDSIASGEGNPDVPSTNGGGWRGVPARWENQSCHRSALSGPALSALALERADPHTSVTFLSQACSGASILTPMGVAGGGGVLSPYPGEIPLPSGQTWMPQLAAVARVLCPAGANLPTNPGVNWTNPVKNQCRPIDALLVTAGANDAGFGVAAEACSVPKFDCSTNHVITQDLYNGIAALPTSLATLGTSIRSGLPVKNVFFAEYPDPTHDQNGQLCGTVTLKNAISDIATNGSNWFAGDALSFALSVIGDSDGEIVPSEMKWLHDSVVVPLNTTVAQAAQTNGWHLVTGIASDFQSHGYCSTTPWIVHYEDSVRNQGDADGTFHPTAAGHQDYESHIYPNVLANLAGSATFGGPASTRFGPWRLGWGGAFFGSHGTFLADVDGDGKKDMVGVGDGYIGVIRAQPAIPPGGVTFGGYETWLSSSFFGSHGTLVGDIDGDGQADVVTLNDNNVTAKLSTGAGFGPTKIAWGGAFYGSHGTFLADVDGDGRADLVGIGDGYVGVIRSQGTTFGGYETWLSGNFFGSHGTFVADVDGDGAADLVGMGDGYIGVMRSTTRAFGPYETWRWSSFFGTHGTLVDDVNGDGKADVVALNDNSVSVALSTGVASPGAGAGGFADPTTWWSTGAFFGAVGTLIGDVNGDGRADLVDMGTTAVGEIDSLP